MQKPIEVMLDLETFGLRPGSVITAIGAVMFQGQNILMDGYWLIDAESCVKLGMHIEAGSVRWWLKQSAEARAQLTDHPTVPVTTALQEFATWLQQQATRPLVWGDGASFDNVLLAEAYALADIPRPWGYTQDRCYRTLKGMCPQVKYEQEGTAHNALDDALSQTNHLLAIRKELGL